MVQIAQHDMETAMVRGITWLDRTWFQRILRNLKRLGLIGLAIGLSLLLLPLIQSPRCERTTASTASHAEKGSSASPVFF